MRLENGASVLCRDAVGGMVLLPTASRYGTPRERCRSQAISGGGRGACNNNNNKNSKIGKWAMGSQQSGGPSAELSLLLVLGFEPLQGRQQKSVQRREERGEPRQVPGKDLRYETRVSGDLETAEGTEEEEDFAVDLLADSKARIQEVVTQALEAWKQSPKLAMEVLGGLAKHRLADVAVHVLGCMQAQRVQVDVFHFNAALGACSAGSRWQQALRLLERMPRLLVAPDRISYNTAITACGKAGEWQLALHFLFRIQDGRLLPNEISYNAAISACDKGGQWQISLAMLNDMQSVKVSPGDISYNAAISSCSSVGQWQVALQLLDGMPEMRLAPNRISFSAAIHACSKGRQWSAALALLNGMPHLSIPPNEICFGAAISACETGGQWQLALSLLVGMPEAKLVPNQISYNAAISACEKAAQWQAALSLLNTMPAKQVAPDAISYSAAISACEKGAQWNEASYSAAMSACQNGGQWQLALSLFGDLPKFKLSPDEISCSAAISACEKGGQWQMALGLLNHMPELRLTPNEISHSAAISACETGGQWEHALGLLDRMQRARLAPNEISYNAAVSACEKGVAWQASLALLEEMMLRRLTPNGLCVGAAANAVRKGVGREAAFTLLNDARQLWMKTIDNNSNNNNNEMQPGQHGDLVPAALAEIGVQFLGCKPGVMAICKPAGVSTEAIAQQLSQTCFPGLLQTKNDNNNNNNIQIVSRLDLPTSGVLPLAFGAEGSVAHHWLQAQFAARLVSKEYLCLCEGSFLGPVNSRGVVSTPLFTVESPGRGARTEVCLSLGREAYTSYEVMSRFSLPSSALEGSPAVAGNADSSELMLLRVHPMTGRTHQIRVHLASIGRPLVGDLSYGGPRLSQACRALSSRLFLHCRRVALRTVTGEEFEAEAALPAELERVLQDLQPVSTWR
ncbi:unnamed protein product, partial [Polarella glacialis]